MSTTAISATTAVTATTILGQHHDNNNSQDNTTHHFRRPVSSFLPPRMGNNSTPLVKKRMVTVEDVSQQEEPMQGLLIIQSDSEYDDDEDEEEYDNESTTTSTSTPITPDESEDTNSQEGEEEEEENKKENRDGGKPLPQIPTLVSAITHPPSFSYPVGQHQEADQDELLLVPTHLEPILESLDSTIEDDMNNSRISSIIMQNDDPSGHVQQFSEEKTIQEPEEEPEGSTTRADKMTNTVTQQQLPQQEQHPPEQQPSLMNIVLEEQFPHEKQSLDEDELNMFSSSTLLTTRPSFDSFVPSTPTAATTTQKPFEPTTTTTTMRPVMQLPHTPEETKPPAIWSIDATLNDKDDEYNDDQSSQAAVSITSDAPTTSLRKRVSKEELPMDEQSSKHALTVQTTVAALSSSVSLCSRCSSSVGGGPSSATTSVTSSQEQQLRALAHPFPRLARPASVMSFTSPRSNSPYNINHGSSTNLHHQQPLLMHQPQQSFPFPSASPVIPQQQQQPPIMPQPSTSESMLHKSQSSPQLYSDPLAPMACSSSKLSIASFSLTHKKDAIKTYRRMASKTNNKAVQMTYANYLLDVARLYSTSSATTSNNNNENDPQQRKNTNDNKKTRETLLKEAGYWIDRLAKAGHPEALYIRGKWSWHPEEEECVPENYRGKANPPKAFKCFQNAARGGHVDAYYELARYFKENDKNESAVSHYEKAAKKGHTLANYKMAKIYLRGQMGKSRNINLGLEYLKKAADASGPNSAAPSFDLFAIYSDQLEWIGIARDSQMSRKNELLALHYLQKSVEGGCTKALHHMGRLHEEGSLGKTKDPWLAYSYYMRAAEDGSEDAMLSLADMYVNGIPGYLMKQHQIAFKWCHRAAIKGLARAEYTLGTYYEQGTGTAKDFRCALEWFSKAASKGHILAGEKLNLPKNAFPSSQAPMDQDDDDVHDNDISRTPSRLTSLRRKATFELVHQTATVAATAEHAAATNFRKQNRGVDPSDGNCTIM